MKQYYPSNSTDGDYFFDLNCANCYKKSNCSIWNRAMFGIHPTQWVYKDDKPTCTSFNPNRPKPKKEDLPSLF